MCDCLNPSFQEVHRFSSGQPMSWGPAYAAMACCHSLMVLDGKIQGDPLDLKMFEATHWVKLHVVLLELA